MRARASSRKQLHKKDQRIRRAHAALNPPSANLNSIFGIFSENININRSPITPANFSIGSFSIRPSTVIFSRRLFIYFFPFSFFLCCNTNFFIYSARARVFKSALRKVLFVLNYIAIYLGARALFLRPRRIAVDCEKRMGT